MRGLVLGVALVLGGCHYPVARQLAATESTVMIRHDKVQGGPQAVLQMAVDHCQASGREARLQMVRRFNALVDDYTFECIRPH